MAKKEQNNIQMSREEIEEKIAEIVEEARQNLFDLAEQNDPRGKLKGIEKIQTEILGRKGQFTSLLRLLGGFSAEERPIIGEMINEHRKRLEQEIEDVQSVLSAKEKEERLAEERIDVTVPGVALPVGKLHVITQVYTQMRDIFVGMGFNVEEGPEIEWAQYNFDMLNFKPDHPARDTQDTFFINDDMVLRTHTSPVQVRTMLKQKPPIRMICPGRVFRADDVDATHSPVFNQMEGLVVDKGITMGDLMGVLTVFVRELYGETTKVRFRPSYFPFTEPSTELDMSCSVCGGKGCRVCKGTGWVEIMGSGMVHPNVLRNCGIDPEEYSGFAFGFGLDRVACIKYGIDDIRLLYEDDIRFLEQF